MAEKVGSLCILFVEDDPLIRCLGCEWLELHGHAVVEAEDAASAITIIESPPVPFTALISDLHLGPGPEGLLVGEHMARHHPHVPIIIATGRPDLFDRSWSNERGWTLMSKPYLPSELIAHLRSRLTEGEATCKS